MGKLLYPERFRHVRYCHTDIRKTFARERKRLKAEEAKKKQTVLTMPDQKRKKA